jgi:hypothetical protein
MKRRRAVRSLLVVCALVISGARPAAADGPTAEDQALSTTLFREAKVLLDAGKVPEACRKLEESQRLNPAAGTLLNLAVCHEKEGKTATAWAEYRQARLIAEREQRDDRLELIDERLQVLEPQLSKLVIEVAPSVDRPALEVTLDGRVLRRPVWGTLMPVDPGEHVVEARAPGSKPWRAQVSVAANAAVETAAVPAWEDESPPATAVPLAVLKTPDTSPVPSPGRRGRTAALIAGGVGVAGLAVGTVFGIRAVTKHDASVDACRRNPCSVESVSLNDSAKTAADVATIAVGVGLIGLGVGAYFWFFGGGSTPASRRVSPMGLGGTF